MWDEGGTWFLGHVAWRSSWPRAWRRVAVSCGRSVPDFPADAVSAPDAATRANTNTKTIRTSRDHSRQENRVMCRGLRHDVPKIGPCCSYLHVALSNHSRQVLIFVTLRRRPTHMTWFSCRKLSCVVGIRLHVLSPLCNRISASESIFF